MTLAIMQPYLFPYIGYYQLLGAVDRFVVYDDVTYIKQGWINRNNTLSNGQALLFTLPLIDASSNRLIRDIRVHDRLFEPWKGKFLRTLAQSYSKAPHVGQVVGLAEHVLEKAAGHSISEVALDSLTVVQQYLGLTTEVVPTSSHYNNAELSGQQRVLDICRREGATAYINPIGGQQLYDKDVFRTQGLELSFIQARKVPYRQFKNEFVPWLSILDVLMFNSVAETRDLLREYDLV
ncbi:hypothetical protein DNI29_12145 [Hymenobacter sediminis]|uniref:WbqC family protein n=1 Tax=Hymenobacter sediminis TaxID=2218621 RepID=UPI000DA68CAF|nr:WbqC family protein [Hymenobacter sediminis]RPD46906.1 hypothetical protein DNI29_12145 [Hymenobacter sediminis]